MLGSSPTSDIKNSLFEYRINSSLNELNKIKSVTYTMTSHIDTAAIEFDLPNGCKVISVIPHGYQYGFLIGCDVKNINHVYLRVYDITGENILRLCNASVTFTVYYI